MTDGVGSILRGLLVVVSSPSGGGKTSVIHGLIARARFDYQYSVSVTTRPIRADETDAIDYYFVTLDQFEHLRENQELVEYAQVHGYWYGTPQKYLQAWLAQGKIILLDIDIQGAKNIRRLFPNDSLLIFLKPPSLEHLMARLKSRATEDQKAIEKRLERVPFEMAQSEHFDDIIVNDTLQQAIEAVERLILLRIEGALSG